VAGSERNLAAFTGRGYDKGRGLAWCAAWYATQHVVFKAWWCPGRLRARILRAFGATVGQGVVIRAGVRVHWPWKLTVGDHTWLGEGAWLLNLEPITIGSHVCVSQEALLCTGSHDRRSPTFEFDNGPITVGDGAWVATRAVVLRGVEIGENAVVGAAAVVASTVPPGTVVRGPVARGSHRDDLGLGGT